MKIEHFKIGTPITVDFGNGNRHEGFLTSKPFSTDDDVVCRVSDLEDPVPVDFIDKREIVVSAQPETQNFKL
ncbi:hypothetical protein [Mangrovibacterium sp.]|uniref:hypothetical protein n=1 Tax=Mangrovibacterium sp. TaxID=1961364 RepID=UPI00356B1429